MTSEKIHPSSNLPPPPPFCYLSPLSSRHMITHHPRLCNALFSFLLFAALLILSLLILTTVTASIFYALYHPTRPSFTLTSFHVNNLNISSTNHFRSNFTLTVSARNPNPRIAFYYDPIIFTVFSTSSGVPIGSGRVNGFIHHEKNTTLIRDVVMSGSRRKSGGRVVDDWAIVKMKREVKRNGGLKVEIEMRTSVGMKIGGSRTKKVGIRVICERIQVKEKRRKSGFTGDVNIKKSGGLHCSGKWKVKIWTFTFLI